MERGRERYAEKRGPLGAGRRLGCQARICGDLVVDVPPESQVHRQVVRKRAESHPIEIDPVVRLYYVEVDEPDMHEPVERSPPPAAGARASNGALPERDADLATLAGLQKALRAGAWKVTVAVRKGRDIVARHARASLSAPTASPSTSARPRSPPILRSR